MSEDFQQEISFHSREEEGERQEKGLVSVQAFFLFKNALAVRVQH